MQISHVLVFTFQIQLYDRDKFAIEPKLVFEVRIAKDCLREVRQKTDRVHEPDTIGWDRGQQTMVRRPCCG